MPGCYGLWLGDGRANLCNPQTCSRLLTGLRLLLPSEKHPGFSGSRDGVQHKMQLYLMSESEHCSRRSWRVLQQLCSCELLLLTGSTVQMRQRGVAILGLH